jgi:hypothetical protein
VTKKELIPFLEFVSLIHCSKRSPKYCSKDLPGKNSNLLREILCWQRQNNKQIQFFKKTNQKV